MSVDTAPTISLVDTNTGIFEKKPNFKGKIIGGLDSNRKKALFSTASLLVLAACGGSSSGVDGSTTGGDGATTGGDGATTGGDGATSGGDGSTTGGDGSTSGDSGDINSANGATMTLIEHEALLPSEASGYSEITLSTSGAVMGIPTVGSYNLAGGDDIFTLGASVQNVHTGGGSNTILTGDIDFVDAIIIGGGDDTLVLDAGDDITNSILRSIETLNISGSVTMTVSQHSDPTTISGTGAADEILFSDVGTIVGAAGIESYAIKGGSDFTLGALGQNVTEAVDGAGDVVTSLTFGSGGYVGTFAGFQGDDVLKVVNGTDISGATGLDQGTLDFGDRDSKVTLDAAQNGSLIVDPDGADIGTQTIAVSEIDTFNGDANIEKYEVVAGSVVTLGALSQGIEETGTGNSTIIFGSGAYSGLFEGFEANDIFEVDNGTDISGIQGAAGKLDFANNDSEVTLTLAQHDGMTFENLTGTQAIVLSDVAPSLSPKAGIEKYTFSNEGGTVFTQAVFGANIEIVSGTSDDTVKSDDNDAQRAKLTVDFSSGGNDVIYLLNDTGTLTGAGLVNGDYGGFGGSSSDTDNANFNEDSLLLTAGEWGGSQGATGADIFGFTATATNSGLDTVKLDQFTGGVVEDVNRTTTDLTGIRSGSVLEINTASYTVSGGQFGELQSIATMLDSLSNVADGEYYIVAYNGSDSNADAGLYYARATEGDGFDFADTNGATGGYDTDSIELLAVFHEVGADELSSLNFVA